MKQQQWKRLELADPRTFALLQEMRNGAETAIKAMDRRLEIIRHLTERSVDADKALTETASILRSYVQSLDKIFAAEVERTGPGGGPVVCFQNRKGMYFESELSTD